MESVMMSPVSAAVAGALISGVVMYTVGERTDEVSAFTQPAPVEYVQTVDGRFIAVTPAAQPVGYANGLQPAALATPAVIQRPVERVAPRQTVYRTSAPAQERVVVDRAPAGRSGKKGALIGAAIGGGAASIYEATKR